MQTSPSIARAGRRSIATLALVSAAAATGCMVGPHYHRPSVSVNDHWSAANDPRLTAQHPVDTLWWHSFNDSTLDRLIDTAYRQNIALQIAGTRILEARAELGIADAQWWPVNRNPVAGPMAGGIVPFNGNQPIFYGGHQVGFDAAWEPDFWGRIRHGTRAAAAAYGATVADYQGALVALSAEVARTYVAIRTYQVLIALANQNVAVEEEGLQVAHARVRHGATSGLDESQATTLLESTRSTVPEYQIGLTQAQNALCTLLGETSGCDAGVLDGPEEIPTAPAQVAIGVPAELLRRRPDIRSAELYAMAQCDRIGMAVSELYPSFDLTGSLGVRTVVTTGAQSALSGLLGIFNPGAFIFSLGANMFWPILGYPRILNNIRVQDARFEQSLLNYQNVVLRAAQEVEDGIAGYLREQEAAASAQNAVVAAQDAVHLSLIQYREGAIDYQRVLDTQRSLLISQNTAARMRGAIATNLVALYKALGGGWELRNGQPVVSDQTRTEMERRTNWGGALSPPRPANSSTQPAPSNNNRR